MQQPQKSNSVSSFAPLVANGSLSMSRQQLNSTTAATAGHSQPGPSGLGHSNSSSILSQSSSLASAYDDKAYTQNALKQIRNSLQPFATKANGGGGSSGLDRRPSSASSNASSSNSIPAMFSVHQQQSSSGQSPASSSGASSYAYMMPPNHAGTYQYGQVNKLSTSASSTQISLGAMHANHNGNSAVHSNCDTAMMATPDEINQKQLIKQLLEIAGLPEETVAMLNISDLNVIIGNLIKQSQGNQPDIILTVTKPDPPPQLQAKSSSAHYPNPPLQYHQLPSHPIVIDRMSLYQPTPSGPQAPISKLLACQKSPTGVGSDQLDSRSIYSGSASSEKSVSGLNSCSVRSDSPNIVNGFGCDRMLLPNQPKILNSAGVPITEDYRYLQQQQLHSHQGTSSFHSKVGPTDSAGNSCYSSSSSSNGAQQQPGGLSFNQQHSSSSLASSNSSSSSSPYHRMVPTTHPMSNGNGLSSETPNRQPENSAAAIAAVSVAFQKRLLASKLAQSITNIQNATNNGNQHQHNQNRSTSSTPTTANSGFKPTAPLPPPPLPPHRNSANAPPPPPIPPHSSSHPSNSSNADLSQGQASQAASVLAAAMANNPQLQQYLKQHMAAVQASNQTNPLLRSQSQPQIKPKPQSQQQQPFASSRPGALSYASSASSTSPQRVTSPISFGRARLKAAALAAAEQHQNGGQQINGVASSVPTNGQMVDKLLAAQVTQKLQNLNLNRTNNYHSNSPPLSYAASSSSGRQSPTPTMSSSSDYACIPGLNSTRNNQQPQQTPAIPYNSLQNLHHKLSSIASANFNSSQGVSSLNAIEQRKLTSHLNSAQFGIATAPGIAPPLPNEYDADQLNCSNATMMAWSSRHAVSQSPIIMQSVKSQKIQKPILQTAVAPTLPPINPPSASSTLKGPLIPGVLMRRDQPTGYATIPTAPMHSASSLQFNSQSSSSMQAPAVPPPMYSSSSNISSIPSPTSSTTSSLKSTSIKLSNGKNPPPYGGGYPSNALGTGTLSSASSSTSVATLPNVLNEAGTPDSYHATPPPPYASAIRANGQLGPSSHSANYHNVKLTNSSQSPPPPPPPPYSISLSMAQQDSIAQIFSNFTAPPPSAYGGSNSSVTSSSTANAGSHLAMQVPTTEPPSYASSMAALAAQRAAVGNSATTSTNVYSPSGPLNSATMSSNSSCSTVPPSIANRPLPLPPPGSALSQSNCDLVNTMESICNSQVSALQSGLPAAGNRARAALPAFDDTAVPPLPPKPSANGSGGPVGPPPPLPPQPPHIQAATQLHQQKLANDVASISSGEKDFDLESISSAGSARHQLITSSLATKSATIIEDPDEDAPNADDPFRDFDNYTGREQMEMIECDDGSQDVIEKDQDGNTRKQTHHSPIPQRRGLPSVHQKFAPKAFKFYMEQHMENLVKFQKQRQLRREQLESEMAKVGLPDQAASEMRRMLCQKESNYIRLRRAKMDRSMFKKIRTIGVGAFGEVALVRKTDVNTLYAMKRLRKADVLTRNQVAHVKAERDILAEADNEWVVKLYFSFQDEKHLYFVMDYIPGGDLMSLLIKFNLFNENLARFYIAELVVAVESVHKMGFIHRDIKPDNVLIDKDGHIKLTDFGLCTGFRWTHDSKYYHDRANSMDFDSANWNNSNCNCSHSNSTSGYSGKNIESTGVSSKPLERRKHRREHHRCLAHSLVGTPNYIAPEVLLRIGYTQGCDWWSVGVILYEMVVGSPPFFANTPEETQQKVINWRNTLRIPHQARISFETSDLITRLCCNAENRIGRKGADEIKAHSFFNSINFDAGLRSQPAPYVPEIKHPMDTSNFDPIPGRLHSDDSDTDNEMDMFDENGFPLDVPERPMSRPTKNKNKIPLERDPKHPQHAFFEFTFRRFFDTSGNAFPIRIGSAANSDADSTNENGVSAPSPTTDAGSMIYGSIAQSMLSENTTRSNIDSDIYDEVYSDASSVSASVPSTSRPPSSALPIMTAITSSFMAGTTTSIASNHQVSTRGDAPEVSAQTNITISPTLLQVSSLTPSASTQPKTNGTINGVIDETAFGSSKDQPTTEPANDPVFV